MALSIEDPEVERLAREVTALTGETLTEAIRTAVAERLERERHKQPAGIAERLSPLALHCASLPDHDIRSPDEIIGYDEHGAPR